MPQALAGGMPTGGRPRQLSARTVVLGLALALADHRPAHLAAAHRALSSLPVADRLRLGVARPGEGGLAEATYRQVSHTYAVMTRAIDPSPVPSFKGIAEDDRAAHLERARAGIDAEARTTRLHQVIDALVEASIPEAYRSASSGLALDWTDHETWARPRDKDDPAPANDPDASWGHAKRNAPGAKDCLFLGYYAQVATMVGDEGGALVPELIRRIAVAAPRRDPAQVMAETLLRAKGSGLVLGDVVADCGYSNRHPETFAGPLRAAGARLVMDLHPADRGPRGTFEGAICANGQLYCPATPVSLLSLGPTRRGASAAEMAAHDQASAETARYKLAPLNGPDQDGYERVACPASAGKLRCALKEASMAASLDHPTVLHPPGGSPPRCCAQASLTVPPQVNAKTRQAHDYPGGPWRVSYARRTAAERTYASLADPSVGGIRRGWCRLFGLADNTFMYALVAVVRNARIVESFQRRAAEETRRAAMGLAPRRRRRRRHQADDPAPAEPAPQDGPSVPG